MLEAESAEEMFDKERELVEIGSHSYNLKEGGKGGWDYVNISGLNNNKSPEQMTDAGIKSWKSRISKNESAARDKLAQISKQSHQNGNLSHVYFGVDSNRTEKALKNAWSDRAKEKRNKTRQEHQFQIGERNSQYGTMWITDGTNNLKIKKEEMIPEGFRKGRVIKLSKR